MTGSALERGNFTTLEQLRTTGLTAEQSAGNPIQITARSCSPSLARLADDLLLKPSNQATRGEHRHVNCPENPPDVERLYSPQLQSSRPALINAEEPASFNG